MSYYIYIYIYIYLYLFIFIYMTFQILFIDNKVATNL